MLSSVLRTIFLLIALTLAQLCPAQNFSGVSELVRRRIPSLHRHIVFKSLPKSSEETFILSTRNGKVIVQANTISAASTAVNHYLNHICHSSISHAADNLPSTVKVIPIKRPIRVSTPFRYRYALNYCTYSYSYAFYQWEDFERELDWMALNGINLMLAPLGTEIVWQQTLKSLGFSEASIARFIPGPAYTAWWLMGNLEGWGGPMSQSMIEKRHRQQVKILKRMRQLGIEPVLQGFPGIVPSFFKDKFPNAPVIPQGLWGAFQRPYILLPGNETFNRVADLYYQNIKKYYGSDIRFLGGDLFHEGGNAQGVDLAATASLVQQRMLTHFPQARWVLQGWNNNPPPSLLTGLDKHHVLLINLAGEIATSWEQSQEFGQTPWLWGSVNHFGGKTDMGGQLPVLVNEPHRAFRNSSNHVMKGIGILPEGIFTNPIVYDFALKTAWNDHAPDLNQMLRQYILYRYGRWSEQLYKAWQLLSRSVFGEFEFKGEGTFESIFCARPSTNVTSVSTWGPKRMQYNPVLLEQALTLFRQAADKFAASATYQYDLVDLARQVMANHGRVVYRQAMEAYQAKDTLRLTEASRRFINLVLLQDSLLATNRHFLLGNWLKAAQSYGDSEADRRQSLENARTQITYWGPDDPATRVHDYANKEWSGLLRDFYVPRWIAFFNELSLQLRGQDPPKTDFFAMEQAWAKDNNTYPTEPTGDYLKMVDRVMATIGLKSD